MADRSKVSKGTEYEQFVQLVYQDLLRAEGVENIKVQQNVQIQGKSGCWHQIDVYWEFRVAGQTHKTAIECKAFNQNVPIGRIRDFYGVLLDVPGLIGTFVTLVGYQKGAKKYAKHYGIALKELRKPSAKDWSGRVKDIHLILHVVSTEIKEFLPRPTPQFFVKIGANSKIKLNLGFASDDPIVFDKSSSKTFSFEELRAMLPTSLETTKSMKHFIPLANHILRNDQLEVEIDGIDFVYDVNVESEKVETSGDLIAQAIIRDVVSGDLTFVDRKGNVKNPL
jgi:hypothetical protein